MHRDRKTKIVATLGPASSSPEKIEALFLNGVDLFRLNFSHGSHEDHLKSIEAIRALDAKHGHPIGIIQDLQGPKLRVGTFVVPEVMLTAGQAFRLDLDPMPGDDRRAHMPHPEIFAVLAVGAHLLLDDGRVRLEVTERGDTFAETRVIVGGPLSNRKGVNVPEVQLPISPLTEKDRRDLTFGLAHGVDWVALSFVQKPEDILEARELIQGRALIAAKLEKPQAIEHLDEIVRLSDGIMVARGDLGVEMAPEDVPSVQKRIIRACRALGRPVIVATQMLDSMVHAPTPTRAEASDVANAVYDGVDAVMLSAESASGTYPEESVAMMQRIIERVESDPLYRQLIDNTRTPAEATPSDSITAAARHVAATISAAAIATLTQSGATTFRAARERPNAPILALTPDVTVARRLTLLWGTYPVEIEELLSISDAAKRTEDVAQKMGFAAPGDSLILTAGGQFGRPEFDKAFRAGTTRALRIITVGEG